MAPPSSSPPRVPPPQVDDNDPLYFKSLVEPPYRRPCCPYCPPHLLYCILCILTPPSSVRLFIKIWPWKFSIFVEDNIRMQCVLCSFFLCDNITDICPRIFDVSFLEGLQTSNFAACNFSRTFFQSWPPDLRWPSITGNCPPKCGNVMGKASSWKTKPINLPFNQVLTVLFLNFIC